MKRLMSSNICFNFFANPDVVTNDTSNESICEYDVYVIFAECFGEDELIPKIDEAEETAYKIVSNKEYSDNKVVQKVVMALDELYGTDPVIDVIIKKRKFPGKDF